MTFLITGASRGIGLELTLLALEQGHKVHALARDPNRSGGLNSARKEFPEQIEIHKCDVTNQDELENVSEALKDVAIDTLINNAGMMGDTDESLRNVTLEDLRLTFETNTIAPLNVARTFLPNLLKSEQARLVSITSKMGSIEDNKSGGYYAYRMSKTALNMFNKSFSIDQPKITSLVIHPGWVRTEMGGRNAPVMTRESARGILNVILDTNLEDSGRFMDYQGNPILW